MLVAGLGTAWVGAVLLAPLDATRRHWQLVALGTLALHLLALAVLMALVLTRGPLETIVGGWPTGVGIRLRADALGTLFAVVSSTVLLLGLAHETAQGTATRTTPALILFMAAGLTGLFLTADVFSFYVFFELSMIAAYALTATGGSTRELGAAFVFAVVNLLGSFLFLIGVGALYHVTGTLDMATVADRIISVEPNSAILAAACLFVAFAVKLGLFPFHFWLPSVYTASRPAVAAVLAGALSNIGAYGLLRFGAGVLPSQLELAGVALAVLGTASIIYGALQALSRRTTSEVLAYSAIGQVGYIIVALAVGGTVGLYAAVLYAVVNALNKALLFLSAGLRGWLVGAAFAVGAFSVAGVPPAAGFLGKVGLFQSGIAEGSALLVALILLGGALSFVYMFQIYQHDHWRPSDEPPRPPDGPWQRAPAVLAAAAVLALGLWPEPLLAASEAAAGALRSPS